MILLKIINGWPTEVVSDSFDGDAPDGHVSFSTWAELDKWKATNASAFPKTWSASIPVPSEVPSWKVVLELKTRGHYDKLDAFIRNMTGPKTAIIQAKWEYGDTFQRDGKAVEDLLSEALGYTPAQVDQLFRDAEAYANA